MKNHEKEKAWDRAKNLAAKLRNSHDQAHHHVNDVRWHEGYRVACTDIIAALTATEREES